MPTGLSTLITIIEGAVVVVLASWREGAQSRQRVTSVNGAGIAVRAARKIVGAQTRVGITGVRCTWVVVITVNNREGTFRRQRITDICGAGIGVDTGGL
jgi:hypothetical protein